MRPSSKGHGNNNPKLRRRIEMTKVRLSKLMALCAILALTFIPNFVTRADGTPDLKGEAQTIATYLDDVGKVARNISELNKKASLTHTEFDTSKTDVDRLKGRLADVERAVTAMIKKLKDNNSWENFDEQLNQRLTDPKAKEVLQKCGGAKKCLEAASRLVSNARELDQLIEPLRAKAQARAGDYLFEDQSSSIIRIIPAAYSFSALQGGDSISCKASRAVMTVVGSTKSVNRAYCLCVELPALGKYGETLAQCMASSSE